MFNIKFKSRKLQWTNFFPNYDVRTHFQYHTIWRWLIDVGNMCAKFHAFNKRWTIISPYLYTKNAKGRVMKGMQSLFSLISFVLRNCLLGDNLDFDLYSDKKKTPFTWSVWFHWSLSTTPKTSEDLSLLMFSEGIKRDQRHEMDESSHWQS